MPRPLRSRPLAWVTALCTLAAIAALMIGADSGGAASASATSETTSSATSTTTLTIPAGPTPVIKRLEPSSGSVKGLTPVRIVGTHLSALEERCTSADISKCEVSVHFGAREATILAATPTNLAVLSPPSEGPGVVNVTVTVNGVTSEITPADRFTYEAELEELEERSPESEKDSARFEQPCVIAPGTLNIKVRLTVETRSKAPESVTPGEEFEAKEASSTITWPAELGNSLYADGLREVRGKVTSFGVNGSGATPAEMNIAKPVSFPEGLPYHAPVVENVATTFTAPSEERTYPLGPYKVITESGNVTLSTNTEPGFREVSAGNYEATGKGMVSALEGYNAGGEKIIGPLTVACNAPATTLASIPVIPTSTSSSTTTITTTTTTTAEPTARAAPIEVTFKNWKLSGSLTVKKLGEAITLPVGCTFNGKAFVSGPLEANTACPEFTSTVKILGLIPTTIGVNFTETEAIHGSITPGQNGNLLTKATARDNIGITSIGLLGLTIPTSCVTSSPVVFPLEKEAPPSTLATGTTFTGETTMPSVSCDGGLLGPLFGTVLTTLVSGPNNPFMFTIEPQA
jgi:IPT/TIG domain